MNKPNPASLPPLPLALQAPEGDSTLENDEAFGAKVAFFDHVGDVFGFDSSRWSLFEQFRLDQIAFAGDWAVEYSNHWGDATLTSPAMRDPTWLDLFAAADWAIELSGDAHHVFIESFAPVAARPGVLSLATGS